MPRRRFSPLLTLVFAGLWLVPGSTVAAEETVVIKDQLRPTRLEIDLGTTVTWRNRDDARHRMRSKDGPVRFDSKNLDPGESFSFTFTLEGSYPYYDHRDRDDAAYFGTIVVGGAMVDQDAPLPETGSVAIVDKSFRPATITIATGGAVEWANRDGETHTVTATDSAFDSGIMNGGATFSQTFAEPGTYPYVCVIHPEMRGSITVADPQVSVAPDAADTQPVDPVEIPTTPTIDSALDLLDAGDSTSVSIVERSFLPQDLEVDLGQTVTWKNDSAEGHTATAADGSFDTGILTVGAESAITFETVGAFDYFCAIHPEMTATITVSEPGT